MRFLACSLFALVSLNASATIFSNFEVDADGWFLTNIDPVNFIPGGSSAPTWGASLGNGNGGVQVSDAFSWTWLANTTKFTGDMSSYSGGTATYDIFIDPGRDNTPYPLFAIAAADKVIYTQGIAPAAGAWTTVSHVLAPGDWLFYDGTTPVLANQAQIDSVLASVVGVYVDVDVLSGADVHRLDNIGIVPEPASLLFLAGSGLALARRRRSSR